VEPSSCTEIAMMYKWDCSWSNIMNMVCGKLKNKPNFYYIGFKYPVCIYSVYQGPWYHFQISLFVIFSETYHIQTETGVLCLLVPLINTLTLRRNYASSIVSCNVLWYSWAATQNQHVEGECGSLYTGQFACVTSITDGQQKRL